MIYDPQPCVLTLRVCHRYAPKITFIAVIPTIIIAVTCVEVINTPPIIAVIFGVEAVV